MEDDDYMSDQFLKDIDVRPGLVHQPSLKRKYDLEKKHDESNKKNYRKPIRILEEEQRNKGLSSAISETNKGFALLQKMGYKSGMSLGKQANSIKEPVPVILKAGRSGLGKETEEREAKERLQAKITKLRAQREREREESAEEYRERMRNKAMEKKTCSDLALSQRICEKLDSENDVKEPVKIWFWPIVKKQGDDDDYADGEENDSEEEDQDAEMEPSEKLALLTAYLRDTYEYCIWCGTHYEDEEDMKTNCPGDTFDCH